MSGEIQSHRALVRRLDERITAVMDCFSGKVLRVFNRKIEIGKTVTSGAITVNRKSGQPSIDTKFWVITGYSTWQTAKAMARKAGHGNTPLASGVWHEVISE